MKCLSYAKTKIIGARELNLVWTMYNIYKVWYSNSDHHQKRKNQNNRMKK